MNENNEKNFIGIDLGILLGDFFRIAKRLLLVLVALVIVFSGLLCFQTYRSYYPMYRADATFTVYVANPLQTKIQSYNTATAEQMAKTFPYILTSSALKDTVKRELGVTVLPSITARVHSNTNIFTLTVTSGDPQLAYDVLNAVIEHYPSVSEFVVGPTIMNLLDESGLPTHPYNSRDYIGALKKGVVLAGGLWALLCLVLTLARSAVHNEEELKRLVNLPCLGILPVVKRFKRGKYESCPMLGNDGGHLGFSEAVRLLRIRTEKVMKEREMKVLLVSSATPGEGKTTVAINLATALAMKGKRTLLVDCDIRNPSVAKALGHSNENGLVDFLKGRISANEALFKPAQPDLYITFAGGPVDNAAEMLSSEGSKAFIEAAREAFDYVILDTPPAGLLSDASEIAHVADGALMVIRQNYAPKAQILEGAQLLSDSKLPLIGCALNYASGNILNGHSSYYGYGYSKYYRHYGETAGSEET